MSPDDRGASKTDCFRTRYCGNGLDSPIPLPQSMANRFSCSSKSRDLVAGFLVDDVVERLAGSEASQLFYEQSRTTLIGDL